MPLNNALRPEENYKKMPNTLLTFTVEDSRARAAFSQLQRELSALEDASRSTQRETRAANAAMDALTETSRRSATDVDRLGTEGQQSATQIDQLDTAARRTNATWQDTNSGLRDARGQLIGAGQDAEFFTKSLDGARERFAGLDAARAAREVFAFGSASVRAAAQMEELLRGLRALEGSQADTSTATSAGQATPHTENFARTLATLKANAEATRDARTGAFNVQQVVPNFQAAIAASEAYANARIAKAQEALAKETQGAEASNQLQVQMFELQRQRLQAHGQLETERQRFLEQISQQRIDTANAVSTAEVAGFKASTAAAKEYTDQLQRQIDAIPRIQSPEAQYGGFTSQLRQDFADTAQQGRSLLSVLREIAHLSVGPLDLDTRIPDPDVRQQRIPDPDVRQQRIPDPGVRQQQIDDQIAADVRDAQTLETLRQDAAEQGSEFIAQLRQSEVRDLQKNLTEQARYYRQFANSVSNLLTGVVTGRVQGFETVVKAFIANSLRIVARASIEYQLRKHLDDTLTTSKIANIRKVAAAQQAGAAGAGNFALPGVGNQLGGLASQFGGSLAGGGLAIGAASLLFPTEIKNLTGGITDAIGNLLSNVAAVPDKTFSPQQIYLKIGDTEIREITDIQDDLRDEGRL